MNTSNPFNNPFWEYSLRLYRGQPVQSLCLELQDRHGGNVNVLLWACWLETQGRVLSVETLAQAIEQLQLWERSVVQPLRQLRRAIKSGHDWALPEVAPTREAVKAAEVNAEQLEQRWLYERSGVVVEGKGDNVALYTNYLSMPANCDWLARWRRALD